MDVLSGAASVIAVASVALQLADGCNKLYQFWDTVKGAPDDVAVIMSDLLLLSSVLQDISSHKQLAPSVQAGLQCCLLKVRELNSIVEEFDSGFRSTSRRERLWSAFKASNRSRQLNKFLDSLRETKSTLMLALMYQNLQRPQLCFTREEIRLLENASPLYIAPEQQMNMDVITKVRRSPTSIVRPADTACNPHPATPTSSGTRPITTEISPVMSSEVVKSLLRHSLQLAVNNLFESGTLEELMSNNIQKMSAFESTATGDYTSGEYHIFNPTLSENRRQFGNESYCPSFEGSHSRVCHQTSSIGVVVGKIWVRTSTIRFDTGSTESGGNFQIITSFIFYPANWLFRFRLNRGFEATIRNSKKGWQFDFNPIRAVPDNSLIFDLCKIGDVRSVEHLVQKGGASILDTNSKGWMPLHFAAAAGHVELCASLIKMGADKRALVYEGPSKDTLSPVTIFASSTHEMPAESKIQMLRLFSDCLELSDPSGDGWAVHGELKKAYNKEKVPATCRSINWFLQATASEDFVAFGPKVVWNALQHAVRLFLVLERDNQFLQKLLNPTVKSKRSINPSQAASISHWLALRASQRTLVKMCVDAGSFMHLGGFDWVEDDVTPSHFVKTLPVMYSAGSLALLDSTAKIQALIEFELKEIYEKTAWTSQFILESISRNEEVEQYQESSKRCSMCGDDYSRLGVGVVAPRWITFIECTKTNHRFHCTCSEFLQQSGATPMPFSSNNSTDGDQDVDEEFPRETLADDIREGCQELAQKYLTDSGVDPFLDTATLLYRAQGRVWLGSYERDELLCATCFLFSEDYIGENGLGTESDFAPMPESFVMFRSENYSSTVEKED